MNAHPPRRTPLSRTRDEDLVAEARALGLDAGGDGGPELREAVRQAQAEAWRKENAEAIEAYAWIAENGLPLERFRQV